MTESALSLEYVPALLIGEDLAVKNVSDLGYSYRLYTIIGFVCIQ